MFISEPEPSEGTARVFEASAKDMGFVMNLTRAWAWPMSSKVLPPCADS